MQKDSPKLKSQRQKKKLTQITVSIDKQVVIIYLNHLVDYFNFKFIFSAWMT